MLVPVAALTEPIVLSALTTLVVVAIAADDTLRGRARDVTPVRPCGVVHD
ncbi:hypothetical protein ACFYXS_26880 [Streptomyces sp. NPDC002574]